MLEKKGTNQYYITRQDSTESNARSYPRKFPFALAKAKGTWVTDIEGNKYLDFLCGAGTLALGHNDDEIKNAMVELLESDFPLHTLDLTTPVKDEFVHTLLSKLPKELAENCKIQFCSPSGTDATDASLKLCKTATGRASIVAFQGGFHGMGHGALACTGNLCAKTQVNSLMPDVHHFPYPETYRNHFGLTGEAATDAACNYFERTLKDPESGITKPAAVILEPIQGEGGVNPAPIKFLQTVRRVTEEFDIPMIVDEIQCGMGRSGKLFAFEHAGIIPDVILISKAIGGGLPLSIVVYNKKLDVWQPGAHTGTFRGNQIAMKAGSIVLERVSAPAFLDEVTRKGKKIMGRMNSIKEKVSIIGDVRGKGLMIGCEFVNPKGQADCTGLFPANGDAAALVQNLCFKNGLIMERGGRNGSVMRCLCPLTVTDDEIDLAMDIFDAAVLKANEKYI